MKNTLVSICAIAAITVIGTSAQATSLVEGSIEAGKDKSITCAACHGPEGNSVNPLWPNIAGQGAPYIVAQLKAFKEGLRENQLMTSQAMMLSDEDMADLAVYYESLPQASQAVADPSLMEKGQALYRGGNVSDQTSACIACHGPNGRGNPAAGYPALNGQHAAYTAKQLRDYASGARKSGGQTQMMRSIASTLGEDEIVALASYIQGLK
jgi:cytochrome c553